MFRINVPDLPHRVVELIGHQDLTYRPAGTRDLEEYVLHFLELENTGGLERSPAENRSAFENGWTQNLEQLKRSKPEDYLQALKPGYFRGSRFFRYNDRLVVTNNHQLEYELFLIARLCIFHAWLRNVDVVCELGCGTCANLLLLSDTMPDAAFIGLDWARASCEIAGHLSKRLSRNISGHVFNMLEPDHGVDVPEGAAILSIHAFEQLGREFDAMLDFILAKRPAIVVQYEPVLEFYNTNSLLDALALRYCRKRGYLEDYYTRLCDMQEKKLIKILGAWRPYLGGVLHESSLVVWRPC
ncbi:MAG: hypothetical protein A4E61_01929 [Syntrophorhabdus sp. PtaB.Bin184]|jgi:hypothetical protein|nr:MAG: hypothetical protein A4E61_01929 [Syntrophorhabdus sp. PtaB.Bin184]